jgi:glycosyltransferase involved in cell wall biosynthesis
VFVLPSTFEPWGLVVNEVMNAGRPILVSDRVGCGPDLVQPGRNGFIFRVSDDAALAGHLSEYLRSEEVATTAGNLSRDIINRSDLRSNVTQFNTAISKIGGRASLA